MSRQDETALYNKVAACLALINRNLKVLVSFDEEGLDLAMDAVFG